MREFTIAAEGVAVPKLVQLLELAPSSREARRLVEQGAVEIDGEKQADPRAAVTPRDGMVVRVGRNYVRLRTNGA